MRRKELGCAIPDDNCWTPPDQMKPTGTGQTVLTQARQAVVQQHKPDTALLPTWWWAELQPGSCIPLRPHSVPSCAITLQACLGPRLPVLWEPHHFLGCIQKPKCYLNVSGIPPPWSPSFVGARSSSAGLWTGAVLQEWCHSVTEMKALIPDKSNTSKSVR